jgi:hypothetical protein
MRPGIALIPVLQRFFRGLLHTAYLKKGVGGVINGREDKLALVKPYKESTRKIHVE